MRYPSGQKSHHGSSMIEVVIATFLTGVVIVGALNVMGGAIKTRTASVAYVNGPMLANELLAEVSGKPYEDPEVPGGSIGLESGEASTRITFDDLDDYNGWAESPPQDIAGAAMTDYGGWTRVVAVVRARRDTGGTWPLNDTGLKKVKVSVTAPDGNLTERFGYRWKEGVLERLPAFDSEIITWAGAELQIGALGLARAGTNLINAPADSSGSALSVIP